MCQIGLELSQFFTLLFGILELRNVHGDADVLAWFSRCIAMSYGTQESDAAVGMPNPVFVQIKIRSCAGCIVQSGRHTRLVFRENGVEKVFGWYWALAGIKAIQASVFR